jgi:hypothetical protein
MNGWDKFDKYVGVQGVLAMILTVAIVAWTSFRVEVPQEIWGLLGMAWGAYFVKNGSMIITGIRDKIKKG